MTPKRGEADISDAGAGNANGVEREAVDLADEIRKQVAALRSFVGGYGAAVLVFRKHGYIART